MCYEREWSILTFNYHYPDKRYMPRTKDIIIYSNCQTLNIYLESRWQVVSAYTISLFFCVLSICGKIFDLVSNYREVFSSLFNSLVNLTLSYVSVLEPRRWYLRRVYIVNSWHSLCFSYYIFVYFYYINFFLCIQK